AGQPADRRRPCLARPAGGGGGRVNRSQATIPAPQSVLFDLVSRRSHGRRSVVRRRGTLILGCGLVLFMIVVCIAAPLLTPYDPNGIAPLAPLEPPLSPNHLLGTDAYGRDVLSRLLYGGRIDLLIAFGATSVTLVVGTLIGLFSGYVGGW